MPWIDLNLAGDGCWPELADLQSQGRLIDLTGDRASALKMALLLDGTVQGNASVTIRFALPDGRVLVTETTLRLLTNAVRAMNARANTGDHV